MLPKIHISVLLPSVDHTHKVDYLEKHQDDHEEEESREEDIEDQVEDQKDQRGINRMARAKAKKK